MKKVRETFEQMDEVAAVEVDFDAKTATLTARPGKTIGRDACEKALAGSSYGVTTFAARGGGS